MQVFEVVAGQEHFGAAAVLQLVGQDRGLVGETDGGPLPPEVEHRGHLGQGLGVVQQEGPHPLEVGFHVFAERQQPSVLIAQQNHDLIEVVVLLFEEALDILEIDEGELADDDTLIAGLFDEVLKPDPLDIIGIEHRHGRQLLRNLGLFGLAFRNRVIFNATRRRVGIACCVGPGAGRYSCDAGEGRGGQKGHRAGRNHHLAAERRGRHSGGEGWALGHAVLAGALVARQDRACGGHRRVDYLWQPRLVYYLAGRCHSDYLVRGHRRPK